MACGASSERGLQNAGAGRKLYFIFSKEGIRGRRRGTEGEKRLGQGLRQRDLEGVDTGVHRCQGLYGEVLGGFAPG